MKQISLRAVVLVQALLALCIPLYYILMVQLRLRSTVPLFAVIVLVLCFGRLKRRAEAATSTQSRPCRWRARPASSSPSS